MAAGCSDATRGEELLCEVLGAIKRGDDDGFKLAAKLLTENRQLIKEHQQASDPNTKSPAKHSFFLMKSVVFVVAVLIHCPVFQFNPYERGFHMDDVIAVFKNRDVIGKKVFLCPLMLF
jgi:hypothetical protein